MGSEHSARATIPNILMAETIETPFHSALIKNTLSVEDGFVTVPNSAGLGIDVDEDLAHANAYDSDGLHLQMQEAPISYHAENVFEGGAPSKS
jgi:hypothetical protein